ncbi:hypothetical protein EGW08_011528 [Elysia chlorotica]|uniref:Uncharacterized protein n=1 Tax=Elysia chlorotica TaxID=188477 RepID=A0A3S1C1Z5_ELYCH|nr:hypothetical protein EGW08_011528 [Elysia chlorotica]
MAQNNETKQSRETGEDISAGVRTPASNAGGPGFDRLSSSYLTIDSVQLKTIKHTWSSVQRLAQNRQEWRSFVAALHAMRHNGHDAPCRSPCKIIHQGNLEDLDLFSRGLVHGAVREDEEQDDEYDGEGHDHEAQADATDGGIPGGVRSRSGGFKVSRLQVFPRLWCACVERRRAVERGVGGVGDRIIIQAVNCFFCCGCGETMEGEGEEKEEGG